MHTSVMKKLLELGQLPVPMLVVMSRFKVNCYLSGSPRIKVKAFKVKAKQAIAFVQSESVKERNPLRKME
uniref:Uncharacterized protein n=1 Tax=Picea glauca TaxID=3330 RepID=A0A101LXI9_PICGL|nr:hypothetical protein ABT39_MTgene6160 [Picea glauca]QHR88783.1 hypothetical protein Q903MT_gene2798 [Picea sitchensis]